jgi:hypothetical protein
MVLDVLAADERSLDHQDQREECPVDLATARPIFRRLVRKFITLYGERRSIVMPSLLLYHAVRRTGAGTFDYLGLALLDTADPTRVIRRSSEWILGPDAKYEQSGGGGIVFPCGWVRERDALRIYYGAADRVVALAHGRVSELLRWLRRHSDGSIDGAGLAG